MLSSLATCALDLPSRQPFPTTSQLVATNSLQVDHPFLHQLPSPLLIPNSPSPISQLGSSLLIDGRGHIKNNCRAVVRVDAVLAFGKFLFKPHLHAGYGKFAAMSEIQSRPGPLRGRGGGGRGGRTSGRGGSGRAGTNRSFSISATNGAAAPNEDDAFPSLDDDGVAALNSKFGASVPALREMFPSYTHVDLLYVLEECGGSPEDAAARLLEGSKSSPVAPLVCRR